MTTIIAIQHEHDVEFAWDSRVSRGNDYNELSEPKVWCEGGIVFGFTGQTAAMDVVWALDYPEYDGQGSRKYLITELLPVLKEAFKEDAGQYDEESSSYNFNMLVAVDGEVWLTDGKLSPSRYEEGIYGIGSGADYAKGAYVAGASVRESIEIAAYFDSATGGTVHSKWLSEFIREEPDPKISEPEISVQPFEVPSRLPYPNIKVGDTTWPGHPEYIGPYAGGIVTNPNPDAYRLVNTGYTPPGRKVYDCDEDGS